MGAQEGSEPLLHIALLNPEIGPNTGSIGRLCLGLELRLHLVHPLGFQTDQKAVRRAGLDYWKHVDLVEHADAASFFRWRGDRPLHLFSARATRPFTAAPWTPGAVLLFGRESVGLPPELLQLHPTWSIPMTGPIRSLNLANAVSVVAYRAMMDLHPALFADPGPPGPG